MDTPDYITVEGRAEAAFTEKKSEFIGYICRTETDEEAAAFINDIRAMHRRATHNVYAYILRQGSVTRYSDDGEPQGTAGVPVLEVLRREGLTDVCCVVTRYFGGILLGGGGLVRAYSRGAKAAVDAARKMIMCACFPFEVTVDYNLYGKLTNILPEFEIKVTDTGFTDNVTLSLLCKSSLADSFREKITDAANGRITLHIGEERFDNFA